MSNPIQATLPRERRLPLPNLAQLLRWLGVAALTGAFATFLFQEWREGDDLSRYLMLLGLTLSLALAGVLNSQWLREPKGARTFLALALGSLPVNFAVLGAFLYGPFALDGAQASYPQLAQWRLDSGAAALLVIAAALPLLSAVAHFAFRIHIRETAWPFSLLYLAGNLALVLPSRSAELSGVMALGLTAVTIYVLYRKGPRILSFEQRVAVALLFLPPLILVGRILWLYAASDLFNLLSALLLHLIIRALARFAEKRGWLHQLLQLVSLFSASWATLCLFPLLSGQDAWIVPALGLGFAALLYEIGVRRLAGLVLLGALTLNLLWFDALLQGVLNMGLGILLAVQGIRLQRKDPFVIGGLLLLSGLLHQLALAIDAFNFNWGALALIGIVSVLAASLLERHGPRIGHWRQQLSQWNP